MAARGLKEELRRQSYLHDSDCWIAQAPAILAALAPWAEPLDRLDASKRRFRAVMGELYEMLCRAAADGGRLVSYTEIRSDALEQETGRRSVVRRERVTRLDGADYFDRADAAALLRRAMETLKSVPAELGSTDERETAELRVLLGKCSGVSDNLRRLAGMHRGWGAFFLPANLLRVAGWATEAEFLSGSYTASGGMLLWEPDTKMTLHTDYAPLDETVLSLLTA